MNIFVSWLVGANRAQTPVASGVPAIRWAWTGWRSHTGGDTKPPRLFPAAEAQRLNRNNSTIRRWLQVWRSCYGVSDAACAVAAGRWTDVAGHTHHRL